MDGNVTRQEALPEADRRVRSVIETRVLPHGDSAHSLIPAARILVCAQLYSTTLLGVPFPLPTPQGRWDQHLRDMPATEI